MVTGRKQKQCSEIIVEQLRYLKWKAKTHGHSVKITDPNHMTNLKGPGIARNCFLRGKALGPKGTGLV